MANRDTFADIQRSRLRRILKIKPGTGAHLFYQGMFVPEGGPLMDVFHYWRDEWEGCYIGYPQYVMIDNTGEYRDATIDETEFIMSHKLERRDIDPDVEYNSAKL